MSHQTANTGNCTNMFLALCLLLQLEYWGTRGISHHLAFAGNCRTISHSFIVLSAKWMKEMRKWGQSEIKSYCFVVCCETSSLLWLKTGGARGVSHVHCIS